MKNQGITVYRAKIYNSDKYAVGYYVPHYMYSDHHYLMGAISKDRCGYPCENEYNKIHELKRIDIDTLVPYTHKYIKCSLPVNEPKYNTNTIVVKDSEEPKANIYKEESEWMSAYTEQYGNYLKRANPPIKSELDFAMDRVVKLWERKS